MAKWNGFGMKTNRGFTLLEVLVALAILAISLAVLLKISAQNASNAAYLRDKTFAHWVAQNQLNRLNIEAPTLWLAEGEQEGVEEMAGREWKWRLIVSNTVDADLREVDIAVFANEEDTDEEQQALIRLTTFIGQH